VTPPDERKYYASKQLPFPINKTQNNSLTTAELSDQPRQLVAFCFKRPVATVGAGPWPTNDADLLQQTRIE